MTNKTKQQKDEWAISQGYEDFADYHKNWRANNKKHLQKYKIKWRKNKNYKREIDYRNALAKDAGVESYYKLLKTRRQEKGLDIKPKIPKGFNTNKEYLEDLAIRQKYSSYAKKKKHDSELRKQKPRNLELANLINNLLEELDLTQSWLADEAGVTKQAMSLYCKATTYPKKEILDKIYSTLESAVLEKYKN